jgi:hypothetical protein
MSSKTILLTALAVAATLAWQSASAQASAVSRDQRRAETAAANKAGELTPAGGGEAPKAKSTAKSTVSRDQRKAETAKMNESGQLAPAGGSLKQPAHGKPSTKTKAQRAAEIEEARKKGEMTPAGQGGPTK